MKIIYMLRRFNGDFWYNTNKAFYSYDAAVHFNNETFKDDMFNGEIVEVELVDEEDGE